MVRIIGVDIPNDKRVDISLTYLYGIGRANVLPILAEAGIEVSRRVNTLTDEEVQKAHDEILKALTEKLHATIRV